MGSYLTAPLPITSRGQIDVYYLGLATASAAYNRGSGNEVRHTIEARLFRVPGSGLDYNWELNDQWVPSGMTEFRRGASQPKPDIPSRTLTFARVLC